MRSRGIFPGVAVTATLFLLAVSMAWAQKVETGYDKSADFSQFKTYAWIPRTAPATNPILATLIENDIEYELNQKGLRKVDSDPDLLVKSYGGAADVQGGWATEDPNYTATGGAAHCPRRLSRRSCKARSLSTWSTPGKNVWCGVQRPRARWITTSDANCWSRPTKPCRKCSSNTRRQSSGSTTLANPHGPAVDPSPLASTAANAYHTNSRTEPAARLCLSRSGFARVLSAPSLVHRMIEGCG